MDINNKRNKKINEDAINLHKIGKLPRLPENNIQAVCRIYISNFTVPQLLKMYGEEMNMKELVEDLDHPKEKEEKNKK